MRFDTREPPANRGKLAEIEPTFIGDVSIGIERDVGDRITIADEPFARSQMLLHHIQRVIATANHDVEDGATRIGDVGTDVYEVSHTGYIRFMTVLLEE